VHPLVDGLSGRAMEQGIREESSFSEEKEAKRLLSNSGRRQRRLAAEDG
jgi:hypothetical protein